MDPLTHSVIGGLAAQTVGVSRRRFWIMCALGSVMDLDILANWWGSWAYIIQHRGISHSILGLVFEVIFFAWILRRLDPGPFKRRVFDYSLPLILHVICDYLTSYGVPLLSPFDQTNYSLGIVGSLNIVPMLFAVSILTYIYMKEKSGWQAVRPAWAFWAVYIMLVSFGKTYAASMDIYRDMNVVPSIMNPLRWHGLKLDEASHSYQRYDINLMKRQAAHLSDIAMPNGDFPVKASMDSLKVRRFLAHHHWPVVRMHDLPNGWTVEWGELMFSSRGLARGRVLVSVDDNGKITGEKEIVSFWTPDSRT